MSFGTKGATLEAQLSQASTFHALCCYIHRTIKTFLQFYKYIFLAWVSVNLNVLKTKRNYYFFYILQMQLDWPLSLFETIKICRNYMIWVFSWYFQTYYQQLIKYKVKFCKQWEVRISMKHLFVIQILQLSPVHHNQIQKHRIFVPLRETKVHHH